MELFTYKEAAVKMGKKVQNVYDMVFNKRMKVIKTPEGKKRISQEEIDKFLSHAAETSKTTGPKEWYTSKEFAAEVGRTKFSIMSLRQNGKFKKVKQQIQPNGRLTYMIHKSDLEAFKANMPTERKKRGLYFKPMSNTAPEILTEVAVVDLSQIEDFVIETGKIPFKNMNAAVSMALQRKDWNDIEIETGMKRNQVIMFIQELKEARQAEPKKFSTVMDYLNAGRPYHPKNRDMLKNGQKFNKE